MNRACFIRFIYLLLFIHIVLCINSPANAQNFSFTFGFGVKDGTNEYQICTSSCQKGIGGDNSEGQFSSPHGIAVDGAGNIYVADLGNNRIQVFGSGGAYKFQFGSFGIGNGQFSGPSSIAVDGAGNIYVADQFNHRIQVFDSSGTYKFQFGSFGIGNGQFDFPEGITLDSSGNIYIADSNNHRIQVFDSSGTYKFQFATTNGPGGPLIRPNDIAVDSSGNIYVLFSAEHGVLVYDSGGILKFGLGTRIAPGVFTNPAGIAVDGSGNIYISENRFISVTSSVSRIGIYDSTGLLNVVIGGNSGSEEGQFNFPHGIAVDVAGNIFVTDLGNDRVQVFSGHYPDIVLKNVDVTQAVSNPDVDNNGTIDLVLNRKTAILVNAEITGVDSSEQVTIKASLLNQSNNNVVQSASRIFPANYEQPFDLFFTPETEGEFNLAVEADPIPDEENEDNNSLTPIPVTVHATKQLVIPFVRVVDCVLGNPDNLLPLRCYGIGVNDLDFFKFSTHVLESAEYILATYPLPFSEDLRGLITPIKSNMEFSIYGTEIKDINTTDQESIYKDIVNVIRDGRKIDRNMKRAVGVVPRDYFRFHGWCCIRNGEEICATGAHHLDANSGALTTEGYWSVAAHEIGHTFKLQDSYASSFQTCITDVQGFPTNGFFPLKNQEINAIDFMGTTPLDVGSALNSAINPPKRWVTSVNWATLTHKLASSTPDPEVLFIGVILHSDGRIEMLNWDIVDGIPDSPDEGPYTLVLLDKDGLELLSIPFNINFKQNIDPFGEVGTKFGGIAMAVPFPLETALVNVIDPDGNILFQVDPLEKALRDSINDLADKCFTNGTQDRQLLLNKLADYAQTVGDEDTSCTIKILKNDIPNIANTILISGCNPANSLDTSKEHLLELIGRIIPRLETRIDPDEKFPCNPPNPDKPGGGDTPDPVIKLNQLDIPSIPESGEGVLVLNLTTDKALNEVEIQIQADGLTPTGVEVSDTLQTTKAVTGIDCNIESDIITCAIDKIEDEASFSIGLKANDGVTGTRQVSVDVTADELENVVRFLFSVIVQAVSEPPPDDGGGNDEVSNNGGCSIASVESKPRLELALLLPLFILARRKSGIIRRIRRTMR